MQLSIARVFSPDGIFMQITWGFQCLERSSDNAKGGG
jgi:hypothetical protein